MNILYVASMRMPTELAAGLAIVRQCEAFVLCGHEVTLLIPNRRNNIDADIFTYYRVENLFTLKQAKTIDLVRFGKFGYWLSRISEMLLSFVHIYGNRKQIDIVYSRDQWMLLLPILFRIEATLICEMHTTHPDFITKFILNRVSKVIVISKGLFNYYKPHVGRGDIQIEPSGVDLKQFKDIASVSEVRTKFNIPLDKIVFGYVGKYHTMGESKGVDEIMEAFACNYNTNPNTHLLIAGLYQNEREEIKKYAAKFNLPEDTLTLLPSNVNLFAQYLHSCDILIMNYPDTKHYAHFMSPSKMFAYMASGKVIVTTDLPSIREVLNDKSAIFTKKGGAVADLCETFAYVCDHINKIQGMGSAAKGMVAEYSWEKRSKRILDGLKHNS